MHYLSAVVDGLCTRGIILWDFGALASLSGNRIEIINVKTCAIVVYVGCELDPVFRQPAWLCSICYRQSCVARASIPNVCAISCKIHYSFL